MSISAQACMFRVPSSLWAWCYILWSGVILVVDAGLWVPWDSLLARNLFRPSLFLIYLRLDKWVLARKATNKFTDWASFTRKVDPKVSSNVPICAMLSGWCLDVLVIQTSPGYTQIIVTINLKPIFSETDPQLLVEPLFCRGAGVIAPSPQFFLLWAHLIWGLLALCCFCCSEDMMSSCHPQPPLLPWLKQWLGTEWTGIRVNQRNGLDYARYPGQLECYREENILTTAVGLPGHPPGGQGVRDAFWQEHGASFIQHDFVWGFLLCFNCERRNSQGRMTHSHAGGKAMTQRWSWLAVQLQTYITGQWWGWRGSQHALLATNPDKRCSDFFLASFSTFSAKDCPICSPASIWLNLLWTQVTRLSPGIAGKASTSAFKW